MRSRVLFSSYLAFAIWTGVGRADTAPAADPQTAAVARMIAADLKVAKGLAIDVGCGDKAELAIELARQTALSFRCLESDEKAVADARAAVDSAGLYGARVSVARENLARLTYPSCCANLVFCGDQLANGLKGRDLKEVYRLLSPRGVAWIGQGKSAAAKAANPLTRAQLQGWLKDAGITTYQVVDRNGLWAKITRGPLAGADEWTHRNHDPANTFGSSDEQSGTNYRLQWAADCPPELASAGLLLAGGREYILGLEYPNQPLTTPSICALDAYTGIELWSRVGQEELPIRRTMADYSPEKSCSDMAATADSLYVLAGDVCQGFDGETGKMTQKFPIPAKIEDAADMIYLYLSCEGDTLYCGVGPSPKSSPGRYSMSFRGVCRAVFALDRTSGQVRWISRTPVQTTSLAVGGGRVYMIDEGHRLMALDAKTGQKLWDSPDNSTGPVVLSIYYRGKLWVIYTPPQDMMGKGRRVAVFSAEDGKELFEPSWQSLKKLPGPGRPDGEEQQTRMLTMANGLVVATPQHSIAPYYAADADTGERRWSRQGDLGGCSPTIATPHSLFARMGGGPGLIDLDALKAGNTAVKRTFGGLRPTCFWPPIPANGMIYTPAPGCNCPHAFRANIALTPTPRLPPAKPTKNTFDAKPDYSARLVKGPAFAATPPAQPAKGDWAGWRGNVTRSGRSEEKFSAASAQLAQAWTRQLAGPATPVAVGGGLIFCGDDGGKLHALDAATGGTRWQFIAEGPIRIAPFLWRGLVYFGDEEGWVYCLRANDGQCAWRFRAAPAEDHIIVNGRFVSRWPVGCGVLVADGVAYFTAGFFPDDQVTVYAADATSGQVQWEQTYPAGCMTARGALALGDGRLFVPSEWGPPREIRLADLELDANVYDPGEATRRSPNWVAGMGRGPDLMLIGRDIVSRTPKLEYTHHVSGYHRKGSNLPMFNESTVFMRDGRNLTAERRDAFKISFGQLAEIKGPGKGREPPLLWSAWPGETMTTAILVGEVLFSAGQSKVFATEAGTGKELWSVSVGGQVKDLAFCGGRLLVVCDSGQVLAFK